MALIPIRGTQAYEDHMREATLPKTQHKVSALEDPRTHAPQQLTAHSLGALPARLPPTRQKYRACNRIGSSNDPGSVATFTLYYTPAWHSAVLTLTVTPLYRDLSIGGLHPTIHMPLLPLKTLWRLLSPDILSQRLQQVLSMGPMCSSPIIQTQSSAAY